MSNGDPPVTPRHLIDALDHIERWCASIRTVLESMPKDQIIAGGSAGTRGATARTGEEGNVRVLKGCPPPRWEE